MAGPILKKLTAALTFAAHVAGSSNTWVTVDSEGGAETHTPQPTTAGGTGTTWAAPPDSLTRTMTYTLSPTGGPTVVTGVAPVATASSSGGTFLACDASEGPTAPFCQPVAGSVLSPGGTYFVTWSPSYFADPNTTVQVVGTYDASLQQAANGFAGPQTSASRGFYAWTVDRDLLSARNASSVAVRLGLAVIDEPADGNDSPDEITERRLDGPIVVVMTSAPTTGGSTGDGSTSSGASSALTIAVPVVLSILGLAAVAMGVWAWRRRRRGAASRRSSGRASSFGGLSAMGIRGGDAKREEAGFSAAGTGGIPLTDRASWSPTAPSRARFGDGQVAEGRNVFREELRRQEREG